MKKIWMFIFLLYGINAVAQDKIETDRPNETQTPQVVPKGYFQWEAGLQLNHSKEDLNTIYHPMATWKYGLLKGMELGLTTEWITQEQRIINDQVAVSGLLPVRVGTKIALWEEKGALPQTSVIAGTTIPKLASSAFKENSWSPLLTLAFKNSLSKITELGYNAGMEWDTESELPRWQYSIAPSFEISDKWKTYFEIFGFIEKHHAPEHTVDAGLLYLVSDNVQVDLAGGAGLTHAADHFVTLGFSFRIH